jgi:hypothetical protein
MKDEDEIKETEKEEETSPLVEKAIQVLLKYFEPTSVKKGAEFLSIYKITEKMNDVIPGVSEGLIATALDLAGFKIEMIPGSFEFYWMLRRRK